MIVLLVDLFQDLFCLNEPMSMFVSVSMSMSMSMSMPCLCDYI